MRADRRAPLTRIYAAPRNRRSTPGATAPENRARTDAAPSGGTAGQRRQQNQRTGPAPKGASRVAAFGGSTPLRHGPRRGAGRGGGAAPLPLRYRSACQTVAPLPASCRNRRSAPPGRITTFRQQLDTGGPLGSGPPLERPTGRQKRPCRAYRRKNEPNGSTGDTRLRLRCHLAHSISSNRSVLGPAYRRETATRYAERLALLRAILIWRQPYELPQTSDISRRLFGTDLRRRSRLRHRGSAF